MATTPLPTATAGLAAAPRVEARRDPLIDIVRAGALGIVVLYHWLFTVVRWFDDGPHASNPIGSTRGLWLLTWVLQVMPLFFVVGGAVHARSSDRGGRFVVRRLRRLVPPAAALVAVVGGLAWIAAHAGVTWAPQAALLVLSPLWFLAVYSVLVLLTPVARWAHGRWGELVPVVLVVAAALIDVARFRFEVPYVAWLSWIVVFGFCHQIGFSWDRLRAAPARFADCLLVAGLGAMVALTNMGLYPRSTVGVPGERFSNMGPPTLVIAALCCLQVGLLLRIAPRLLALAEGRGRRLVAFLQERSMVLYLIHGPALALSYAAITVVAGRPPETSDATWWVTRPLWFVVPAAVCAALLHLGRVVRAATPSLSGAGTHPVSPTTPIVGGTGDGGGRSSGRDRPGFGGWGELGTEVVVPAAGIVPGSVGWWAPGTGTSMASGASVAWPDARRRSPPGTPDPLLDQAASASADPGRGVGPEPPPLLVRQRQGLRPAHR